MATVPGPRRLSGTRLRRVQDQAERSLRRPRSSGPQADDRRRRACPRRAAGPQPDRRSRPRRRGRRPRRVAGAVDRIDRRGVYGRAGRSPDHGPCAPTSATSRWPIPTARWRRALSWSPTPRLATTARRWSPATNGCCAPGCPTPSSSGTTTERRRSRRASRPSMPSFSTPSSAAWPRRWHGSSRLPASSPKPCRAAMPTAHDGPPGWPKPTS